jgi:xanthosine utilization system XapX-like protein
MDSLMGLVLGLIFVGIVASLLAGSFLPAIVVIALIGLAASLVGGSGRHRRR